MKRPPRLFGRDAGSRHFAMHIEGLDVETVATSVGWFFVWAIVILVFVLGLVGFGDAP